MNTLGRLALERQQQLSNLVTSIVVRNVLAGNPRGVVILLDSTGLPYGALVALDLPANAAKQYVMPFSLN